MIVDPSRGRWARAGLLVLLAGARSAGAVAVEASPPPRAVPDYWNAIAIDQAGDPVVAGVSLTQPYGRACQFVVAKLSRADGTTTWRAERPDCGNDETYGPSGGEQVLIDAAGDVVVGRRSLAGRELGAQKLSGQTGELLWTRSIGEFSKDYPYVHALALDPAGNVVAAGGFATAAATCWPRE